MNVHCNYVMYCVCVRFHYENVIANHFTGCSELQSTATSPSKTKLNDHKRNGAPLLADVDYKTSKKRLCMSKQLNSDVETPCPIEKKPEDKQSAFVVKNGASVFNVFGEVKLVYYEAVV